MNNNDIRTHISTADFVPLSELQRGAGKVIERLQKFKRPLLILDRGKPVAFLLPQEQYEALLAKTGGEQSAEDQRKKDLLAELEKMIPQIIKKYRPEKIILFGSMASGTVGPSSDLDLIIIKRTARRSIDRQKDLLKIVRPTIATDFFIYTPAEFEKGLKEKKHFFETEILKNGKVLYDKAA